MLAELGVTVADGAPRPPQEPRLALRTAFARMVQSLCDDRLHCFCWDDAQAMDAATIDTILSVVGRSSAASTSPDGRSPSVPPMSSGALRAVFLLSTRQEAPELVAKHQAHHGLVLDALSDDDAARLIATRVGARVLAPDLLAFCRERAGGHPLFLEELVKS